MKDKTVKQWFLSFFIKDFNKKLDSAKKTYCHIIASTDGGMTYGYDDNCNQIRGIHKKPIRFTNVLPTHPLVVKYR